MSARNVSRRAFIAGAPAVAGAAVLLPGQEALAAAAGGASPKDYGAVGDGVADDSAALNACLAANRVVDLGGPENTYLIRTTVQVAQPVSQLVTGQGATVKAVDAITMMRFKHSGHRLAGVTLDGTNASTVGLAIEGTAPGSTVEDCAVLNTGWTGISVWRDAHRTRIARCTVRHCGHSPAATAAGAPAKSAICVSDADFCAVLDNELLDCDWGVFFRADRPEGIGFYDCRGNTITCATPAPAQSQGISNGRGRHGKIADNTVVGFADNSIDCYGCEHTIVAGNITRGGKDGVFVGDASSRGITITGNVFSGPQRGVRVLSTVLDNTVTAVVISGNTVSQPSDGGILVSEAGGTRLSGITITDNDLHVNGAGRYGVKMVNAETSRISGNRVYRCREHAIHLEGVDIVQVTENTLQDAGHSAPNTFDAVYVTASHRVVVRDNTVYGSARYAVNLAGDGTGMTVAGNRWRALVTGGVNDGARNTVSMDNQVF